MFSSYHVKLLPVLKEWNKISLLYSMEPLMRLPVEIYCIKPHSYESLGAPYGKSASPWMLREEVIRRLLLAEELLRKTFPHLRLAVFDAWRPIRVQKFMYDYSINQECLSRGIDPSSKKDTSALEDVVKLVSRFWASPSFDKSKPPPHSTGGAIDLTLATNDCNLVDMGGEIDLMGPTSEPDYYLQSALKGDNSSACLWQLRRNLLANVMIFSGFVQHPNEWWHFSYGDQLWAWTTNATEGLYGSVDDDDSESKFIIT